MIDRLSLLDEALLRLEGPDAPMHVGWTLLMEGEPPSFEQLTHRVADRLELLPRLRRRVMTSPLHHPLWVDDPGFDLRYHVARLEIPRPGGSRELRGLVGAVLSEPLDPERPLWRLYLLEGLRGGGFAMVAKAHHALVDGLAAVQLARLLVIDEAARRPRTAGYYVPAGEPALAERLLAAAVDYGRLGRSVATAGAKAIAKPGTAAGALRRIAGTLAPYAIKPAPAIALNEAHGGTRSVAFAELPLAAAEAIGARRLATVTDVVLATAGLALGRHLSRPGDRVSRLRVLCPISTRAGADASALGNQISFLLVELPVSQADPRAALAEVACQMAEHERLRSTEVLDGVLALAKALPLPVRDGIARYVTARRAFNTIIALVPGPSQPVHVFGRLVRAAYPAVPLPRAHGLSIGVLSYRERLHVGLSADPAVVPDLQALARDLTSSFDALRLAVLHPAGARPRAARGASRSRARGRLTPV